MTAPIVVTSDPAVVVTQDVPAVTAVVPVATGTTALGTAAFLNVGAGANQIVQLDGSDRLPAVDGSQLTNLHGNGIIPNCGLFQYTSSSQCTFIAFNGEWIRIAGTLYNIPSAGVVFSNAGLLANTAYNAYIYVSAGVLTAEFSTVARALDATAGNVGTWVKSGDTTRTLVGKVQTNGSSQFVDSAANRAVLSWFNRRPRDVFATSGLSDSSLINTSIYTILSGGATNFLVWGDAAVSMEAMASLSNSAGGTQTSGIAVDGSVAGGEMASSIATGAEVPHTMTYRATLAEGYHAIAIGVKTSGGNVTVKGSLSPFQTSAQIFG